MTEFEVALLNAALQLLKKAEPEIANAIKQLVDDWLSVKPLTPAIKNLEAVALAKTLGLNPDNV